MHIVEIGGTVGDIESLSFLGGYPRNGREGRPGKLPVRARGLHAISWAPATNSRPSRPRTPCANCAGWALLPDVLVARSEIKPPRSHRAKLSMFTRRARERHRPVAQRRRPSIRCRCRWKTPASPMSSPTSWASSTQQTGAGQAGSGWSKALSKNTTRPCGSASSPNTWTTRTPICACSRPCGRPPGPMKCNVELVWVNAEELEKTSRSRKTCSAGLDGIVVPGGFGQRGLEGKIKAAQYSLDQKMPYLGLCLGLQMGVIAAARRGRPAQSHHRRARADSPNTRSLTTWPTSRQSRTPAAPCAWATTRRSGQRQSRPQSLRPGEYHRTPPPPLRVQQRISRPVRRLGHPGQRPEPRRPPGGIYRRHRPPVLPGHPGPPGVPQPAQPPAPAVRRPHPSLLAKVRET